MSITIGFEVLRGTGTGWRAGSVYFADLLQALRLRYRDAVRLLMVEALHGEPIPEELQSLADGRVTYPHLKRFTATWALNHAQYRIAKRDLLPDRVLRARGIDVLFCGVLERHTTLPTIALLADFQHLHLPELFSASEIKWRNSEYRKTAERATRIVMFGESVRDDFEKFAPEYAGKARVLPPVSDIPDAVYAIDLQDLLTRYGLPEKFVYLPNQFWQHKNHLVAFEAIRRLKARGQAVFVVCTGNPVDNRDTGYFSQILQTISQFGIRDSVALLGNVPRADVMALMRQAAFVLNPSRFEGFGLSLAEARAIGKRVLASNLPAHREQKLTCVEYFEPGDATELAERLGSLWNNTNPGPDRALEAEARRTQHFRQRTYAEQLMQIIGEIHTPALAEKGAR